MRKLTLGTFSLLAGLALYTSAFAQFMSEAR